MLQTPNTARASIDQQKIVASTAFALALAIGRGGLPHYGDNAT